MNQFRIKIDKDTEVIVIYVPDGASDFSLFKPGDKYKHWTLVYTMLHGTDYHDACIHEEHIENVTKKDQLTFLGTWEYPCHNFVSRSLLKKLLQDNNFVIQSWETKPEFPKMFWSRKKVREYKEQHQRWLGLPNDFVLI